LYEISAGGNCIGETMTGVAGGYARATCRTVGDVDTTAGAVEVRLADGKAGATTTGATTVGVTATVGARDGNTVTGSVGWSGSITNATAAAAASAGTITLERIRRTTAPLSSAPASTRVSARS
jgi:hypothetical protein